MSFQAVEQVLKLSQQKGAAKLVMVCIAYHTNKDTGLAWPSLDTLAEYCNCSDRYIRDILTKLETDGEIEIGYKQGQNGTNLYKILLSETTTDPEPEFQVSGQNGGVELEPTRNYSSATPGTIVPPTWNHSSPEPKEPKRNLNSSSKKQPTERQLMFGQLSELCQYKINALSGKQRGKIANAITALEKLNVAPDEVSRFGEYWFEVDWRGKKGQPPDPAQVPEEWGRFEVWLKNGASQNGHGPALTPEQQAKLEELKQWQV